MIIENFVMIQSNNSYVLKISLSSGKDDVGFEPGLKAWKAKH